MEGVIVLFMFLLYVAICACVGAYANRLGRLTYLFVILSFLFTPLFTIIVLFLCGETKAHRRNRIEEEAQWFKSVTCEIMEEEQNLTLIETAP